MKRLKSFDIEFAIAWVLLAVLAIVLLLPVPATAQQAACRPLDDVLTVLAEGHNEQPVLMARNSDTGLIFVAEPGGGTWSVLQVNRNGEACLVASGDDWQLIPTVAPGVPS